MNKKILAVLGVVVFLLAVSANGVFAGDLSIVNFYTVGSDGSTDMVDTFGWDETPWIYYEISAGDPGNNYTVEATWTDPDGSASDSETSFNADNSGPTQVWQSLAEWDSKKSLGDWTVDGTYFRSDEPQNAVYASTSFTVTPEPVSSILFLVGGATLGFRRLRKNRMSA
ncbi:MAG TPA: PEP-CTERM sorting domain-containing protein [Nitrospirae bacterium]|nr:hypothetical protein BMS3Abin06_02497 [bacterium BMS3Abin06]HDH13590.1 PEP-CTERM sorting domain-containing protein [Nitrospirota bacterium]HDZ00546.1 PEP-CTERM sorting domain-containing protein [Nitrospirota bacterium]